MALQLQLLVGPRFLSSFSFSPLPPPQDRHLRSIPRAPLRCYSYSSAIKMSSAGQNAGAAVLWFKHDLRLDDHAGLLAASQYPMLVPLYVFDRRILSRFSDEMLELLLFALEDLRKSLKDQGSGLVIRFRSAESVIQALVKEVVHISLVIVIFNLPGMRRTSSTLQLILLHSSPRIGTGQGYQNICSRGGRVRLT